MNLIGNAFSDIEDIQRRIPHRYPFLFIDLVKDINLDRSAIGVKNVTFNEPHFQGHFPKKPIMPGVTIVEAMAQTSAILVSHSLGTLDEELLVYFMNRVLGKFFVRLSCIYICKPLKILLLRQCLSCQQWQLRSIALRPLVPICHR